MSARSCNEKKRYTTDEVARAVAVKCWQERGTDLRVYSCRDCGGFHLTSVDAAPMMREGWRPPRAGARAEAELRKRNRVLRRTGKGGSEEDWR